MAELVMYDDSFSPIRLRAHTLLCLQGFRGEGYSYEFVENMAAIHRSLTDHPEQWVKVVASPDVICAACPHQHPSGCGLNGPRSEQELNDQDHLVLQRLDLKVGSQISWQDLLTRIQSSMCGDDLGSICGSCRWLPLGYCREGINRLRRSGLSPIGPLLSKPLRS
jgi:uncharacterized protein